jgi:hypothetical protein
MANLRVMNPGVGLFLVHTDRIEFMDEPFLNCIPFPCVDLFQK